MANEQNLIPNSERTPEELREQTRKGGIASGEARRRKKTMREWAEVIGALNAKVVCPDGSTLSESDLDADVVMQQYRKAHNGDTKAAAFIANLKGEEQVAGISNTTIIVRSEEEAEKLRNIDKLGI